jgi:phage FluMu protein Com
MIELTKVKCECCNQTQCFRDREYIYIKCVRCKTHQMFKLADIMDCSSEIRTTKQFIEPMGL